MSYVGTLVHRIPGVSLELLSLLGICLFLGKSISLAGIDALTRVILFFHRPRLGYRSPLRSSATFYVSHLPESWDWAIVSVLLKPMIQLMDPILNKYFGNPYAHELSLGTQV